ncbi:MAG: hypothetical protein HQ564_02035 [Candidatus Saganbacteria bacterium]|nr:hypothetical protein [Candidatus Saganbacteria bacterium]
MNIPKVLAGRPIVHLNKRGKLSVSQAETDLSPLTSAPAHIKDQIIKLMAEDHKFTWGLVMAILTNDACREAFFRTFVVKEELPEIPQNQPMEKIGNITIDPFPGFDFSPQICFIVSIGKHFLALTTEMSDEVAKKCLIAVDLDGVRGELSGNPGKIKA